MGLSQEQIKQLMKTESRPKTTTKSADVSPHARPIQVGPLRYNENDARCASKGCSGPTRISVGGVPYCSTHALYKLNQMLITERIDDCDCNAGKHSMRQCHIKGCPVWERSKLVGVL